MSQLEGAVQIARDEYRAEKARLEDEKAALQAEIASLNEERTKVLRGLAQEKTALLTAGKERAVVAAEIVAMKEQREQLEPIVRELRDEAVKQIAEAERHAASLKQVLNREAAR